jgi:hypothetical protein
MRTFVRQFRLQRRKKHGGGPQDFWRAVAIAWCGQCIASRLPIVLNPYFWMHKNYYRKQVIE